MTTDGLKSDAARIFPVKITMRLTELVLGHERDLVARVAPLARRRSMALDLAGIERVDAAGIAALIELYAIGIQAGHAFRVFNPEPHVARVIAVCGLDRILVSENATQGTSSGRCIELSAA